MKIKLAPLFAITSLVLLATQAQASSLVDGSAEDGKAKSLTCTACHGAEGNSANSLWPNLADQGAPYTYDQLQYFKDGTRQNALMSSQAMMLSDEDMADLAVYYESLPVAAQPVKDPSTVSRGEALYRGGDSEAGIAACIACHGPRGNGNPAAKYPLLRGQHADYTAKQLRDYKSGERVTGGKTQIMQSIAQRLSEEDILALSSYVQGLK